MTTSFLVEFRLQGFAKQYAYWVKTCIDQEARRLRIRELEKRRFVSHITLFGPARSSNLKRVTTEIQGTCRKYALVPFRVGGFDVIRNPKADWLYLDVEPSFQLEQLRYELAQNLIKSERTIFDTCESFDHDPKCKFHTSIGKYDPRDERKLEKLLVFAETKCSVDAFKQHKASMFMKEDNNRDIHLYLLRVTVLGKWSHIENEYDLVVDRLLSRQEALSKYWYKKSIERLKELLNPIPLPPSTKPSVANGSIYFIGDTHFDHKNIIRYCHRPFSSADKMNETIKNNWNKTVSDKDTVYFLGDWTFGWKHRPAQYWIKQLKGQIISIEGSHDREAKGIKFERTKVFHANGHSFLLIHDPKERKTEWHGWIIHGHVHNNKMDSYPFINGEQKTINVSVELLNYKPVSLNYLLSLDLDSIKWMDTIDSQPERW